GLQRELSRDRLERVEHHPALGAARDVLGEEAVGFGGVLARQALEHVARQELLRLAVAVDHPDSSNAARSFRIAANVLVFTVPSGIPSSSAICTWVFPPKYAISSTCRSSGGRPARDSRTSMRHTPRTDHSAKDYVWYWPTTGSK